MDAGVSVAVPSAEEFALLERRVAELEQRVATAALTEPSPYMTIPEAAELLRCSRQRIDDLLSQRRLNRHKDGARTLVSRAEIEGYLRR